MFASKTSVKVECYLSPPSFKIQSHFVTFTLYRRLGVSPSAPLTTLNQGMTAGAPRTERRGLAPLVAERAQVVLMMTSGKLTLLPVHRIELQMVGLLFQG